MSICLIFSSFFFFLSISFFLLSVYFMMINYCMFIEFCLFSLNTSNISGTFIFDWMSLLFMSFVMFISSMVIFYSEEYMLGDMNINRFILLVVMFVVSMMFLIISPNMISILLGWDGLGLVSYCLVIYYQNIKSYNAGMVTALMNRVGDVAILLSISWLVNYGSWNFLFFLDFMMNDYCMFLVSWLVVLAAFTKSAQIPFSSWLPAAMAAPTPVSSLVHSSTLVTAGVYLLIRFSVCFSVNLMYFMLLISSLTMFMSGLGANFEYDLKKIIALSTLSQLGLMMSILFVGDSLLAFFHLLTHALFKALLFMCAGNIIHLLGNCQDIRFMGSAVNSIPLTCCFFFICNMALCGIPFLSGFYSKDLILEVFSMGGFNMYMYIIFYLSIGLTVSYTFRLMYFLLFDFQNSFSINMLSEGSKIMLIGMFGLIMFVVFMGSSLSWLMLNIPYFINLPIFLKWFTLFVIFLGAVLGIEFSKLSLNYKLNSLIFINYSKFFSLMWNLPLMSSLSLIWFPLKMGGSFYKSLDQGWTEFFGSQGLYSYLFKNSMGLQFLYFNNLKIFLMITMIFIFLLLML
uniref:NADH-ubiquinone oxidoreductase chain 5 n=1 Tax=Gastrallus laevigatus TaxID=1586484 RepID=A0A343C2Z1_9COLE|nr:NADH dehydrogenase subunit 5 [Gastrallus laevigatus]